MKLNVENLTHNDLTGLSQIQPEGWPDIIPHYKFYIDSLFCSPVKLRINNQIVAIGTTIMNKQTAWLGHIIVHVDHRNKGLGTLVTKALIDSLPKTHFKTIFLIATKLGEPVYRKLGFEKETEYVSYKREGNLTTTIATVTPPFHFQYQKQILDLDYQTTGEFRNELLIPHLNHAKLIIEDNSVKGFYLPTFGEGLVIASSATAGKQLLLEKHASTDKNCLPVDNKVGHEFLLLNGFTEFFRGTKMRLGLKIKSQPENIYSRIGGNLG